MGGRVAEQLVFGQASTGAANDLAGATDLATRMVREFGMSQTLGPVGFASGSPMFLGTEQVRSRPYAEATQRVVDEEVATLLRQAEDRATAMLSGHRDALERLTELLLERETVDGTDVDQVLAASPANTNPSAPPATPPPPSPPMARALRTLDPELARRLIVSRQRLARPLPAGPVEPEAIMDVASDLASLQLDPISVVARSHLLVLRSRLGRYDPADLEALLWRDRRLFEFWARRRDRLHRGLPDPLAADAPLPLGPQRPQPQDAGLAGRQPGPAPLDPAPAAGQRSLPTSAIEDRAETAWQSSGWTAGRNVDRMLDVLWTQGRIMVAGRQGQQRVWDLAERCLPAWAPTRRPPEREVVRLAAQRSLRALGVATARDIDRHFTAGRYPGLAATLAGLERAGRIEQVHLSSNGAEHPGPGTSTPTTCPCWSASGRATGSRGRPCSPLRQPPHRPRADRAPVRLPLPHGDLRPQSRPPLRLLRPPRPPRRPPHRPGRSRHRPRPQPPGRPGHPRRARRPGVGAPAVAAAVRDLATFLGADGVELRQPPPRVWRDGFA